MKEFQAKPAQQSHIARLKVVRWIPPGPKTYKVNYDGAMFTKLGEVGIGIVVRNEKGEVMASIAKKIPSPESIEMLEALAARRAAIFSVELGLHQVVIKGDSEIVFKALSSWCLERSGIGHIIKDCKSISCFLQTCSFSHTRRQGNYVAHALAKREMMSSSLLVWMESVPPDISYLVFVDVIP